MLGCLDEFDWPCGYQPWPGHPMLSREDLVKNISGKGMTDLGLWLWRKKSEMYEMSGGSLV